MSRVGLTVVAMVTALGPAAGSQVTPPRLVDAVRNLDRLEARELLTAGVDVNEPQPDGATALHWAVHLDDLEMTDLLVEAGADVNVANDLGMTPLLMACRAGSGALVERLLAAGADPNTARPDGETALMAAARSGSLQAVRGLLVRGAAPNATEATRDQSALMWAIANRHPDVARALLEHGADVHARSRVRRRVFNMGGSRSAGSASRGIALEEVAEGGSSPLLFAARSGDVESARLLLDAGANVEDESADGNRVLVVAAHSGHGALAALLLARGADPNVVPLGYTALHAAVLRGRLKDRGAVTDDPVSGVPLVKALLAHGADPGRPLTQGTPVRRWSHDFAFMERWTGATPFWLAAKFLEIEMMQVLADAGADPRRASDDGTTPLMAAAGLGYSRGGGSAFIRDRRDFSSYNPVASAELGSRIPADEERRALEAVTLALDLGADVNAASDSGDTALHAAASHGMNHVIAQLIERGADRSLTNRRGQTAQDLAVYVDGIAGDTFVRQSTADLLRPPDRDTPVHSPEPRERPEARVLTNPVGNRIESVTRGAATYTRWCAMCHGPDGRGDGRLAAATAAYGPRPSNLADRVWQQGTSDGEVFLTIRDGIGPDYAMDAYEGRLSDRAIWELVSYLRTLGP